MSKNKIKIKLYPARYKARSDRADKKPGAEPTAAAAEAGGAISSFYFLTPKEPIFIDPK
jgi:hypothetical protein